MTNEELITLLTKLPKDAKIQTITINATDDGEKRDNDPMYIDAECSDIEFYENQNIIFIGQW